MREPGDSGPLVRLAPFTTPLAWNEGGRPAAAVKDTMLRPENVKRYALLLLSVAIPRGRSCVWLFTPNSSAVVRGGHWRVPVAIPICAGLMSITCSGNKT